MKSLSNKSFFFSFHLKWCLSNWSSTIRGQDDVNDLDILIFKINCIYLCFLFFSCRSPLSNFFIRIWPSFEMRAKLNETKSAQCDFILFWFKIKYYLLSSVFYVFFLLFSCFRFKSFENLFVLERKREILKRMFISCTLTISGNLLKSDGILIEFIYF